MIKEQFSKLVAKKTGNSQVTEAKNVNAVINTLLEVLTKGEKVVFSNFGVFEVVDRPPRNGVNPCTGDNIIIPARKAIVFRTSKSLRKAININGGNDNSDD